MSELLRVENISKRLGRHPVLREIDFSVHSGEILGIIGPNGAGKTTLMECLTGLLPMDTGEIYWNNRSIAPQSAKQVMFYLPDGILPYPEQPVESVLRFFQRMFGANQERLEFLVDRLDLSADLAKRVDSLSKGFQRRVLLSIGLLSPQPLLILDEPFDGFDLRRTLGVMRLLRETLTGRTLLLSIHQLTEAEKICDRFLLLNDGRVAALGSLAELQKQAAVQGGGLEEVFLAIV